jgi:hypothetical protein
MDCINGGVAAANKGIIASTLAKQSSLFTKFQAYLAQCNIQDTFLDSYSQAQRVLILTGYAHHVRRNRTRGASTKTPIQGNSVATAISNVVQTFRQNLWPDPTHDTTGHKSAIIKQQMKSYRDSDPARKSQACLPIKVWLRVQGPQASPFHSTMGELLTGALFFAMRSCEYTTTSTVDGPKKTKIVTCKNVRFYKHSSECLLEIRQTNPLSSLLGADCVSITFVSQKNGEKDLTITQYNTNQITNSIQSLPGLRLSPEYSVTRKRR